MQNTPKAILKEEKPKEKPVSKPKTEAVQDFLQMLKIEAKALKEELPPTPEPSKNILDNDATVIVHCHPAIVKKHHDELYDQTRYTTQYGQKFDFDALIIDMSDLEIRLFSKSEVSIGSILYPSKYKTNDENLMMYRWWRVAVIEPFQDQGYILLGKITEKQRDFS